MAKIISIANQKGGVGKTTTCVNFAVGLSEQGFKVLCLDFDPQGNLSDYLGHESDELPTITELMLSVVQGQQCHAAEAIRKSREQVDYIPADIRLSGAELFLAQAMFRERVLSTVLRSPAFAGYDYILVDCLPSLGILLTNALIASDGLLIPVQAQKFALSGIHDLLSVYELVKAQANHTLEIEGVLLTMSDYTNMAKAVESALREMFGDVVYTTTIQRSVEAANSTYAQRSLVGLPKSKLGSQYRAAVGEFLVRARSTPEGGVCPC